MGGTGRGRRISEFEASLVYKVSSRTARVIQRNPVSEKRKGKERKGKERKGKERKGKEKGKERKGNRKGGRKGLGLAVSGSLELSLQR